MLNLFSKKNRTYLYLVLVVILIILVGLFKDSLLPSGNTGTIVIKNLEENSVVFLDNREKKRVSSFEESLSLKRINRGSHSVLISRDGFWPWLKEIEIEGGEIVQVSPFFVPTNTNGFLVGESDPEYSDILNKIGSYVLPSFEEKIFSKDGLIAVWVDDSTLFAEWQGDESKRPSYFCNEFGCHNVLVPLGVGGKIRAVDFYKERNDVFIVAFGSGVFAIEIDAGGNQNFQPIFEGEEPSFVSNDKSSIYVLDGALMQVAI